MALALPTTVSDPETQQVLDWIALHISDSAGAVGPGGAHAPTHEPGGLDPMNVDGPTATGSLRTLGFGANQAMPGDTSIAANDFVGIAKWGSTD